MTTLIQPGEFEDLLTDVLRKLKTNWKHDLQAWKRRNLPAQRYIYV